MLLRFSLSQHRVHMGSMPWESESSITKALFVLHDMLLQDHRVESQNCQQSAGTTSCLLLLLHADGSGRFHCNWQVLDLCSAGGHRPRVEWPPALGCFGLVADTSSFCVPARPAAHTGCTWDYDHYAHNWALVQCHCDWEFTFPCSYRITVHCPQITLDSFLQLLA
jgi:hypothetical protein